MLVRQKGKEEIMNLEINYHLLLNSWYHILHDKFLRGEYMQQLMSFLYLSYEDEDIEIRPKKRAHIFRAFSECDLDFCNCIFVTEFPTTTEKESGIGLGNRSSVMPYLLTPEMDLFRRAVETNLYGGKPILDFDVSLKESARNGVLYLNTALTCLEDDNQAHVKHWEKFISEIISSYDDIMSGKAFVFIGEAAKFAPLVNQKYNEVFIEENSINDCVKNKEYWSTDIFKKVNNYLIEQFGRPYSEETPFI
ncbi:MAG: hypothetical protein ACSLE0_08185 [Chitinophagaceae bacterium]